MLTKHFGKMVLGFAIVTAIATAVPQGATAQSEINDKISRNNGAPFFANRRASRNIQHARDYSRSIQQYTTQVPTINPGVTQAESQMLGQQIQGIQREMIVLREENLSNPQVVQQVTCIETNLAQAASTQKMLHEECCKDSPDGKVCGEMAGEITSTLDQISEDHAKLLKTMGHEDAAHDHAVMTHEHEASEAKSPTKSSK